MFYSAIDEGLPIILCDFNYPSLSQIGAYAHSLDYDIQIFAPGFSESEVCNPLDFLRDSADAQTARQLATVINKNFHILNNSNEDGFFGPSGDQLTQAVLMLTKEFGEYADIMTSTTLIKSKQIVSRLIASNLNPWIRIAFSQLFSSASSEKTVAGILTSTLSIFTSLVRQDTLGYFLGKTTLPLKIRGKQMIVLGLDSNRYTSLAPLMFGILQMLITSYVSKQSLDSPVVVLGDFSFAYVPALLTSSRCIVGCAWDFIQHIAPKLIDDCCQENWKKFVISHAPKTPTILTTQFDLELRASYVERRFPIQL
ncbi:type IV secretory system conjugative DNA transfer family protein [Komarekiella sp. 'clone 1']|uniref:Type IV secretory system conjugative DNA transfer family protein n=1 Tax=Komarekiella delphini-convector SJRDD-AB1 TaxID=2593771 RepID=A0AA40VUL9_9NOST|nr:type IV secretory system conjugative DNA transfer family protein [Komarekiella delphini-convector]MBD6620339.1 type IV secretory system conjugative DNA transfer family protein [Komarekiella delphini-convector SJRDD-AB1]